LKVARIKNGHKKLLRALLHRVIEDYLERPNGKDQKEAEYYLFESCDNPLSFRDLCGHLEIDVDAARIALRKQFRDKFPNASLGRTHDPRP